MRTFIDIRMLAPAFLAAALTAVPGRADAATESLGGVAAIDAGEYHVCALIDDGTIDCWGQNDTGQLGDGTTTARTLPVAVELGGHATAIATGSFHSCAIVDGALECWGANAHGELGDGSAEAHDVPTPVAGLSSGVTAVDAAKDHTCAIVDGSAMCWGRNTSGDLGIDEDIDGSATPVAVAGLTGSVSAIATGTSFSCAIVDGGAKCWGAGGYLGNGSHYGGPDPVDVSGLESGVSRIAAGNRVACAVQAGNASCWGYSGYGGVGSGEPTVALNPLAVVGIDAPVTDISVGDQFACALTLDDRLFCWGLDDVGQIGNGGYQNAFSAVEADFADPDPGVLATGGTNACAARGGEAYCWGQNRYGQLGIGDVPFDRVQPMDVEGLNATPARIAMGLQDACAFGGGGELSCWGANNSGQLGIGGVAPSPTAQPVVAFASGVEDVALRDQHSCAVVNGAAYCWGANSHGELGNGSFVASTTPVMVSGLDAGVEAIAVGQTHSCAIVDGAVTCWGSADQLGSGDGSLDASVPTAVVGLDGGATAIAAGTSHTCAVVDSGIECWGVDDYGALGIGMQEPPPYNIHYAPVQVDGLPAGSGATDVASADLTTCAIVAGGARCWGMGYEGQLGNDGHIGDGDLISPTPVDVIGLSSGVTALAVGTHHVCAIATGGVMCWGDDNAGELGDGVRTAPAFSPVAATVLTGNVTAIAADHRSTCAIVDGAVRCFGDNSGAQLGTGGVPWTAVPTAVGAAAGVGMFHNGFDG